MRSALLRSALLLVATGATACSPQGRPDRQDQARSDSTAGGPSQAASSAPLIPQNASLNDVNKLVRDPFAAPPARDSVLARHIQLGYRIVRETPKYAPKYVGNTLTCSSCHLNAGQKEGALPLVGVASVFPQYRSRAGRLISLEDRIRGCFSRSMNGTPPPTTVRS